MLIQRGLQLFGIVLGACGLGILGYSIYLLFFLSEREDLIRILPKEGFEFFVSDHTSEKTIFTTLNTQTLPDQSFLVGYSAMQGGEISLISIGKKERGQEIVPSVGVVCETVKKYLFCIQEENSPVLYGVIESIEQEKSTLASLFPFHSDQKDKIFREGDTVSFFGKTTAFPAVIAPFFPEEIQWQVEWSKLLWLGKDSLPYFSGSGKVDTEVFEYELLFHKKEKLLIFPPSLAKNTFPPAFFSYEDSSRVFLKSPQQIYEFLTRYTAESSFPEVVDLYTDFGNTLRHFLEKKVSLADDIHPLFLNDLLIQWKDGSFSTLFSVPSEHIAEQLFQKYHDILLEHAELSVPEKKGFSLQDGSVIYEMVPSSKNIEITEKKSEKGEMKTFTTYASSESTFPKEQAIGVFDSYVFLSNSAEQASVIWEKSLKEDQNTNPSVLDPIFLLGIIQKEDIPYFSEQSPFTQLFFTGKESEDHISFSVKLQTE